MALVLYGNTVNPVFVLAGYDAVVSLATSQALSGRAGRARGEGPELALAAEACRMREVFQKRTGAFGPEDSWFETRTRAFWDDALTTQRFAALARPHVSDDVARTTTLWDRAHRGLFLIEAFDDAGAHLVDLWSGAELVVGVLDEAQATAFKHAEGPMDARVVACGTAGTGGTDTANLPRLFVLPGALHHRPDALDPLAKVLTSARDRGMNRDDTLDALLRMELVFRSSSRVKAAFAYRIESLPRQRS